MNARKRRFARYPNALGSLRLDEACDIARSHGMLIIGAFKASFCVCHSIALYGTAAQMRVTETEWATRGAELMQRFRGKFPISTDIERGEWVDKP